MYNLFFNKQNEQKKWFVLAQVTVSIIFAAWGLILSINSYRQTIISNANHEQIDTLSSIVKELKVQNNLLSKQVDNLTQIVTITKSDSLNQRQQLNYLKSSFISSVNPKLTIENTFTGDSTVDVVISNKGGDLYNMELICRNNVKYNGGVFDDKKYILKGDWYQFTFANLKQQNIVTLKFVDKIGNHYKQILLINKQNNEFISTLKEQQNE